MRNFRVSNRQGSYFGSSLWRYIEEALAQTIALTGRVNWLRGFSGLSFPVKNGYVFLVRGGGRARGTSEKGILIEGAGLLASAEISGMGFQLWFKHQPDQAPLIATMQ